MKYCETTETNTLQNLLKLLQSKIETTQKDH